MIRRPLGHDRITPNHVDYVETIMVPILGSPGCSGALKISTHDPQLFSVPQNYPLSQQGLPTPSIQMHGAAEIPQRMV